MAEEYLVGIDFGACNLKAVTIKGKGFAPVQLNKKDSGQKHAPNLIFYNKKQDGNIDKIIGFNAANRRATDLSGKNYIDNIKRRLELPQWSKEIANLDGRAVTAKEAAQDVFCALQKFLKSGVEIHGSITVPVCYTIEQREIIREAAEQAGLKVDAIISEPLGALLSLADVETDKDEVILIFDFGGSTLDVSIFKVEHDSGELKITELAAAGEKFGGLDIDRDIYKEILLPRYQNEFDAALGSDIANREDHFLLFAQEMKEQLFVSGEKSIAADELDSSSLGELEEPEKIKLSRDEVNEMFARQGYRAKIEDLLDALLADLANGEDCYQKEDLTQVRIFGGSSKIPFFAKILRDYFGDDLLDGDDFEDEEALLPGVGDRYLGVAAGAVNYLRLYRERPEAVSITNYIPFCIGYADKGRFRRGIESNMPFGFEMTNIVLSRDSLENNDWRVDLYQRFNNSENNSVDENIGDAVFLRQVHLDKNLYASQGGVRMEMRMVSQERADKIPDGYGVLRLHFLEQRLLPGARKPELILVEEHFIPIGGR